MLNCIITKSCRRWIQCIDKCKKDKNCLTKCSFFYQTKRIGDNSKCLFKNNCINIFTNGKTIKQSDYEAFNFDEIQGNWVFLGYLGDYEVFDLPCQKYNFKDYSKNKLYVSFSIPLERYKKKKLYSVNGYAYYTSKGQISMSYKNYSGPKERWHKIYQSQKIIIAKTCFFSGKKCYEYSTLILAKKSKNHSYSSIKKDVLQLSSLYPELKDIHWLNMDNCGKWMVQN